jgi:uncharacterized membrane protein
VESAHICGFGLLVGTASILDMRLMGVWFKNQLVSKLAKQLSPWILAGLVIMLITGPYLLSSDAGEYIQVTAFKVKMALLAAAMLFHFVVIRRAAEPSRDMLPLGWRKLAGAVSLSLWLGVVVGGLWIGNL